MESKVKGKKKKGSGAGNLPGALDVEIREAQEYLDSDEQVTPSCSPPTFAAESFGSGPIACYV